MNSSLTSIPPSYTDTHQLIQYSPVLPEVSTERPLYALIMGKDLLCSATLFPGQVVPYSNKSSDIKSDDHSTKCKIIMIDLGKFCFIKNINWVFFPYFINEPEGAERL